MVAPTLANNPRNPATTNAPPALVVPRGLDRQTEIAIKAIHSRILYEATQVPASTGNNNQTLAAQVAQLQATVNSLASANSVSTTSDLIEMVMQPMAYALTLDLLPDQIDGQHCELLPLPMQESA